MDGTLKDGRTGMLFLCSRHSTHALGVILSVELEGRFSDQLLLFRDTVDIGDANGKRIALPEVKTKGYLEGTAHDIECDLCNAKRTWWKGSNVRKPVHRSYAAE